MPKAYSKEQHYIITSQKGKLKVTPYKYPEHGEIGKFPKPFDGIIYTSKDKAESEIKKISNPKKRKNPGTLEDAVSMNESFHGRKTNYIDEIYETTEYEKDLAQLGILTEIEVLVDENNVCPIGFGKGTKLCCSGKGTQLYVIGGNQSLNLSDLGLDEDGKQFYEIGPCFTISYIADKHHLEGSVQQKKGSEYIHEFGEEGGETPIMIYDALNKKIQLVGGSYHIEDRGIVN